MPSTVSDTAHTFTTAEVCRLLDCSHQRLSNWSIVTPSINKANRSGHRNLWSFEDVLALRIVKKLNDAGVRLNKLGFMSDLLHGRLEELDRHPYLCVDLSGNAQLGTADQVASWITDSIGSAALVLDVAREAEELHNASSTRVAAS